QWWTGGAGRWRAVLAGRVVWGGLCAEAPRAGDAGRAPLGDATPVGLEEDPTGQGPWPALCPAGLGRAVWAGEPLSRRLGGRRRPVCGPGARGYVGVSERAARGSSPEAGQARPAVHTAASAAGPAPPGGPRLGPASADGVAAGAGALHGTRVVDRRL